MPDLDVTALPALPALVRLAAYGIREVRPLAGGASSLTYQGMQGDARVVVKVAPPGVQPILHRDVLRQARLLRGLSGTGVPVPVVLAQDPGAPVEVPPFFVMTYIEGSSIEPLFDLTSDGAAADVVADRMRNAARVLARLHEVNPADLALGDEPVIAAADEVERWSRTLRTVDEDLAPGWEEVARLLHSSAPAPIPPAIVHGDFRLGNLLAVGRRITAVIDWEIWSIADPRIDMGWFLLNCDGDAYRRPTPYVGKTPSRAELVGAYAEQPGGSALEALDWFVGLAAFKSAATWALIAKHNRRRSEPDPSLEEMVADLPRLLERARGEAR